MILFEAPESIKIFKLRLGIEMNGNFGLLDKLFGSVTGRRLLFENFPNFYFYHLPHPMDKNILLVRNLDGFQ